MHGIHARFWCLGGVLLAGGAAWLAGLALQLAGWTYRHAEREGTRGALAYTVRVAEARPHTGEMPIVQLATLLWLPLLGWWAWRAMEWSGGRVFLRRFLPTAAAYAAVASFVFAAGAAAVMLPSACLCIDFVDPHPLAATLRIISVVHASAWLATGLTCGTCGVCAFIRRRRRIGPAAA